MERANLHLNIPNGETAVSSAEKRSLAHEPSPPADDSSRTHKKVSLNQLINKLNHLNFIEQPLFVVFRHKNYPRSISLEAHPHPCQDAHLTCSWKQTAPNIVEYPDLYAFEKIVVPDGKLFVTVHPEVVQFNRNTIDLTLPEICSAIEARKAQRHRCQEVQAYVSQNGALFFGNMIDFSAYSFRLEVQTAPPQTFDWIDTDLPVHVILFNGNITLYTGDCRIVRQGHGNDRRELVIETASFNHPRFRPKEFRSHRYHLVPFPTITFSHPFSRQMTNLNVINISGSGLAVEEERDQAILMPGLIIPELEIRFADGSYARCTAQVIYSRKDEQSSEDGPLHCGIAILDMPINDHIRMLALLQQAEDKNTHICNRVNLDDLWNFFFETGFIYPGKYEYIEKHKAQIKQTYSKLYLENPTIARHFIYQKNGRILGHVATIRFFQRTWLIHHHAAVRSGINKAGLMVLNQIGQFANDSHRLYSMKLRYLACFYRPTNKFPKRVFGGAEQSIGDKYGCSTDTLAYFYFKQGSSACEELPPGWNLRPAAEEDLLNLESVYDYTSGGLMIRAMGIGTEAEDFSELTDSYQDIGLIRKRHLYALERAGEVCAVIMANRSDLGLNMSDLTNCITILILNHSKLNADMLQGLCAQLIHLFDQPHLPVLLYPSADAISLGVNVEKEYVFWALNTDYGDEYFRYLNRLIKFIK